MLVPGIQKTDFPNFSGIFTIKMAGNPGISSETTRESRVACAARLGITSETTRESRVRRLGI